MEQKEQLEGNANKPLFKATSHCPFSSEGEKGQKINIDAVITFLSEGTE